MARIRGSKPVHVVPNAKANSTAVYFDDEGTAHSLTSEALLAKELHGLRTVKSKAPHHGAVVPLADGTWLVTRRGDDALPDTIEVTADDGEVRPPSNAELHGDLFADRVTSADVKGEPGSIAVTNATP